MVFRGLGPGRVQVLERHGGIFKCGGGKGGSGDLGCVFFGPTITTQSKKSWAQVFSTKLRNMYFCSAYFFRYRYVTLQTYIWICMCIYLSMYLRLYIYLSVCLSIYLPNLILAYLIYIYLYYLYYLSLSLHIYIYTCMNRDIRRYVSVYGTCLSSCI